MKLEILIKTKIYNVFKSILDLLLISSSFNFEYI